MPGSHWGDAALRPPSLHANACIPGLSRRLPAWPGEPLPPSPSPIASTLPHPHQRCSTHPSLTPIVLPLTHPIQIVGFDSGAGKKFLLEGKATAEVGDVTLIIF